MSGFVYRWYDSSNGMYYVGSHKGSVDDSYKGSGKRFKRAYKKRPECFTREVFYIGEHYLELEEFILCELDAENNPEYYNLKNAAIGGATRTGTRARKRLTPSTLKSTRMVQRILNMSLTVSLSSAQLYVLSHILRLRS